MRHRPLEQFFAYERGLGTELLRRLISLARGEGIAEVFGSILPENRAMQEICRQLGFKVQYSGHEMFAGMRNPYAAPELAKLAAAEKLPITVTQIEVDSDESVRKRDRRGARRSRRNRRAGEQCRYPRGRPCRRD